jgi:hypothetical protein
MVKRIHIFIVLEIAMTIIKISFDNFSKINNSESSESFFLIDNKLSNKLSIVSPNYCTLCQGGGCGSCTPRS